jgi:phospholipase/carboxylesterase
MHGYTMTPDDLSPFGASLGLPTRFVFPKGRIAAPHGGLAWWPVDEEKRERDMAQGPRDLFADHPGDLPLARAHVINLVEQLKRARPAEPLVLGGFSQGGMLACDVALHMEPRMVDALVLLSASRIALDTWRPRQASLHGMPVFVAHGEADPNLAFDAGLQLAEFARGAGANVTWLPFSGGHEIPLTVWRGLRRFLKSLPATRE